MNQSLHCLVCNTDHPRAELAATLFVCPSCGYHFRMEPYERVAMVADPGSFKEINHAMPSLDPVGMEGYRERLSNAAAETGLPEAVVTGVCAIKSRPVVLAVMAFSFIGGSMGSIAGEKIAKAMLEGLERKCPVIIYASSGGARMQEGIYSLMQMAKTASGAWLLDRARIPLFIVLCDPTSGGVIASFASLGDVILAEPGAFIGFSGPRVIETTINGKMPEGLQRAERQLERGFVDIIAPRAAQRDLLDRLLRAHRVGGNG